MSLISENGFLQERENLTEEELQKIISFDEKMASEDYKNFNIKAALIFLCFNTESNDYEVFYEDETGLIFGSSFISFSLKDLKKKGNIENLKEEFLQDNIAGQYADKEYCMEIKLAKKYCISSSFSEFQKKLKVFESEMKRIEEEIKQEKLNKMMWI